MATMPSKAAFAASCTTNTSPNAAAHSYRTGEKLSTEEVAAAARLAPQSIRAALCRQGHWAGLRPVKLVTGRLLWDANEVSRVLNGEVLP